MAQTTQPTAPVPATPDAIDSVAKAYMDSMYPERKSKYGIVGWEYEVRRRWAFIMQYEDGSKEVIIYRIQPHYPFTEGDDLPESDGCYRDCMSDGPIEDYHPNFIDALPTVLHKGHEDLFTEVF